MLLVIARKINGLNPRFTMNVSHFLNLLIQMVIKTFIAPTSAPLELEEDDESTATQNYDKNEDVGIGEIAAEETATSQWHFLSLGDTVSMVRTLVYAIENSNKRCQEFFRVLSSTAIR